MKTVLIILLILFFIYKIVKYYFKVQFTNLQKLKEKNKDIKVPKSQKITKNWEAETIDFEEIKIEKNEE